MTKAGGKSIERFQIAQLSSEEQKQVLLAKLKERFEQNKNWHPHIKWEEIISKLNDSILQTLYAMEESGGEPDIMHIANKIVYIDTSTETPNRKLVCYDQDGEQQRNKKGVLLAGNAVELSQKMGARLLSESEYIEFQQNGSFDLKTSSWIDTPEKVRELGGALFGDRRYGRAFIYHNGANSFFSDRGFRVLLEMS